MKLEEQLSAQEDKFSGQDQEEQEEFRIEDDSQANWALKKTRQLKQKRQEKEEFAQQEIDKIMKEIEMIEQWLEDEVSKIDDSIDCFEGLLADYAMQLKEKDENLKTHSLPFGELKFRKQRPKYNYNDDKLLEFLEENEIDAVRIKKKPDKRKLKQMANRAGNKLVLESGQVVDGVEIQERGEKFNIDVPKGDTGE
ncbi:host-nuclease inhibitor Gam family protein [Sporohalobacter salinus]|uniref:host-nuclease inhibitor Gam family protein n=1 Tax=Sporohalobacter salinus TaxID=1494606 RepID=UPI00195F9BF4|nr:host-nuclease inhibitor Gam family protein [Sporohalobacter salinus]MBM7624759.1 DNA-binding protein H-NS [Sporohalobacter salinus]